MERERRRQENTDVRTLVDCLKAYVDARDAIWSLRFFDKLFRADKCRRIMNEYDNALRSLRGSIKNFIDRGGEERPKAAPGPSAPLSTALISEEELDMLLGRPAPGRKKARQESAPDCRTKTRTVAGEIGVRGC